MKTVFTAQDNPEILVVNSKDPVNRSQYIIEVNTLMNRIKKKELDEFIFTFLPFLHGVHSYAFATDKQTRAMHEAGIRYLETTIEKLVYTGLLRLLPNKD